MEKYSTLQGSAPSTVSTFELNTLIDALADELLPCCMSDSAAGMATASLTVMATRAEACLRYHEHLTWKRFAAARSATPR
jgi:hypothetical protein